jgi:dihydrofolate reductase
LSQKPTRAILMLFVFPLSMVRNSRSQFNYKSHDQYFTHLKDALEQAIALASDDQRTVWICGGERIYREALPRASELYLTKVRSILKARFAWRAYLGMYVQIHRSFAGDTKFPAEYTTHFPRTTWCHEITEGGLKCTFSVQRRHECSR